jgi:hypothetical protein
MVIVEWGLFEHELPARNGAAPAQVRCSNAQLSRVQQSEPVTPTYVNPRYASAIHPRVVLVAMSTVEVPLGSVLLSFIVLEYITIDFPFSKCHILDPTCIS